MWELYHGMPAWRALQAHLSEKGLAGGLRHVRKARANLSITELRNFWTFPAASQGPLPMYAELASDCLLPDPALRPTFTQV